MGHQVYATPIRIQHAAHGRQAAVVAVVLIILVLLVLMVLIVLPSIGSTNDIGANMSTMCGEEGWVGWSEGWVGWWHLSHGVRT